MKSIKSNQHYKGRKVFSRIVSILIIVVGFIACLPFILTMLFGPYQVYLSAERFFYVIMFIFAMPTFFFGIINFLIAGKTSIHLDIANVDNHDVSRIRHAVEMDRMTRR